MIRYRALTALLLGPLTATAAECSAESGERRVPLLELFTSEGCDSCPPADRWITDLPRRGFDADRVVILAFHVDYWDRLGWTDRFGQARFSERQRVANQRNGARSVYKVQAGENRGKRLEHDFVVRDLAGPLRVGTSTHAFQLDRAWNRTNLGIAAVVSHARTGKTLQALALPLCR